MDKEPFEALHKARAEQSREGVLGGCQSAGKPVGLVSHSVSQSACIAFASVRQPSTNHGNVEGNVYASSCCHSPSASAHISLSQSSFSLSPRPSAFNSQFAVLGTHDSSRCFSLCVSRFRQRRQLCNICCVLCYPAGSSKCRVCWVGGQQLVGRLCVSQRH